jgi:hypothetical protein
MSKRVIVPLADGGGNALFVGKKYKKRKIMSEEILLPHPSEKVIRKSEDYVLDNVGKVTVMTAIDPKKAEAAKEPVTLYQGYAILGANVGGAIQPFPVEWLITGANSIEEAFAKFQEQAVAEFKKGMEDARKRMEEHNRRIVVPTGPVPNLKMP